MTVPQEVPLLRSGPRAGYTGKDEYDAADKRLRRALAQLAREVDPGARVVGAQLAAAATSFLAELAARGEAASPTMRRRQRRDARLLAKVERLHAERQA
ncbi:hypothetical protein OHA72_15600 [Dactylosporangium sp. NBC_01737]|uniref:hypothetical protein n=1 Tax=Dactylosporangium sp. NBC_01737 TaxID=2975959 RepID=UPI002E12FA2D|nr:hypothetical protein OHA72_15600 [Dactylosporangium sp. NBC_01737]